MKKILLLITLVLLSFTFTGCGNDNDESFASYSITGKIYSGGETQVGWEDVNVTLDGDETLSTMTDADGNFAFSVPIGEYRITPMQKGITFDPIDTNLEVNTMISDVNFTVVAPCPSDILMASPSTSDSWQKVGSLVYKRFRHTATLLNNSNVLVVGGLSDKINARASAELYDPETGEWTTTGSLAYERYDHTATLLNNGKVLVVGGSSKVDNLAGVVARASAELYDPETGKWTTTGSLTYERTEHTATLLKDGKVLITGGEGEGSVGYIRASSELYTPKQ